MIIGGTETTATTMTGVFNHLARNPDIQNRLSRDVRVRFKTDSDIKINAIQGMPYLDAVVNEASRLCNPVPGGLPRVVPDGGDTYCGHYLPGGVSLAPSQ